MLRKKIGVKKLTIADTAFFRNKRREDKTGDARGIQLDPNVFIDKFYPNLSKNGGSLRRRLPLQLRILGPGLSGEFDLSREIVSGNNNRNWRLGSELIPNPIDEP